MAVRLTNLSLAPAQPEDLPALTTLAVEAFGEAVRQTAEREFPTGFQTGIRSPLTLLVAKEGPTPIGMVGLLEDYTYPDTYCLSWLAVTPAFQRQGLGGALVTAAIKAASLLITHPTGSLILATAMSRSHYYQRFGFVGQTPLHPHPHHAEPHILLSRPLTK